MRLSTVTITSGSARLRSDVGERLLLVRDLDGGIALTAAVARGRARRAGSNAAWHGANGELAALGVRC